LQKNILKKNYKKTSWHEKPYFFFGDYLRDKYQAQVLKIPLNVNFSCPNRDGTLGYGGCIFCSDDGSASPATRDVKDILDQIELGKKKFKRLTVTTKYISYFQAYTNTYSNIKNLKKLYDRAISPKDIIGLMIGTRPDYVSDDVLDLIASYKKENFELWLELGMQSSHEKSLKFLNRRHSNKTTVDAIMRAYKKKIPVCVHIIIGIPGETWEDIMETATFLSSLPISGVKIHHLHIISGTPLENYYKLKKMKTITMKEYISILCDFLERLRPDIIIHRLFGDRDRETLVAPLWGLNKGTVQTGILEEFSRRTTYQGFLLENNISKKFNLE